MLDQITIHVNFEINAPSEDDPFASSYPYRDALIFTEREYKALSNADISRLKRERHDVWRANVLEVVNRPSPSAVELRRQADEAARLTQRDLLTQGIAALDALDAAAAASVPVEPATFVLPPSTE